MIDLCLLGTGGTMPLWNRWLTSLLVRYKGHCILIDCGEATQIAAQHARLSLKSVDCLLITHLHADHISGLPGILLSMANSDKTTPLNIIGPPGLRATATALQCITPKLPFDIQIEEIEQDHQTYDFYGCKITAFRVYHRSTCYGYNIELARQRKFNHHQAQSLNIPVKHWSQLQNNIEVEEDGQVYHPDMVLGPPRPGLKLTYCTDTRPTENLVKAAANSDLFICEGMYGDDSYLPKAIKKTHMLFSEAAQIARDAGGVKELWLTHYSPSLHRPKDYRAIARAIFPQSNTARDGWKKQLQFTEEAAATAEAE